MEERRVILLGKTGNGKSSTGNSILGENIFEAKKSSNAVTSQCAVHTKKREDGRVFTVCDTPGLFCDGEDQIEMALKLQKSVEFCPEPHAFLLVFSGAVRMTSDEKYTVKLLRVLYGDEMFDHCIVVITRGNEFESESEFEEFWSKNDQLKKIVESCGNRVVTIENAKNCTAALGIERLLEMIEQLAKNGSYDNRFMKTHTEVLQEYIVDYGSSKSEDIDNHLDKILNTLERRLKEEEKRLEEEKRKAEDEKRKAEDEKRNAEDAKRKAEDEKRKAKDEKRKAEDEKRKAEDEKRKAKEEKRNAEDAKIKAEGEKRNAEDAKRKAEDEKIKAEGEKRNAEYAKIKAEEEKRKAKDEIRNAEDAKIKAEDEKRNAEDAKRKAEDEKRSAEYAKIKAEEEKRKAEDEKRNAEYAKNKAEYEKRNAEDAKRKAEDEKRNAEDAKIKAEEETRKAEDAKRKAEEETRKAEDAKIKAEYETRETQKERKKLEEDRKKLEEEKKTYADWYKDLALLAFEFGVSHATGYAGVSYAIRALKAKRAARALVTAYNVRKCYAAGAAAGFGVSSVAAGIASSKEHVDSD